MSPRSKRHWTFATIVSTIGMVGGGAYMAIEKAADLETKIGVSATTQVAAMRTDSIRVEQIRALNQRLRRLERLQGLKPGGLMVGPPLPMPEPHEGVVRKVLRFLF